MGTFVNGELSEGPAVFFTGEGRTLSFSAFKDGRPLDGAIQRFYFENGYNMELSEFDTKVDVSGCLQLIKQVNKNNVSHGQSVAFTGGWIQEGEHWNSYLKNGDEWSLQPDGSYGHYSYKEFRDTEVAKNGA